MTKKTVALAQQNEMQKLAEQLHTKEGIKNLFRIAKQMMNKTKEVIEVNCI